MCFSLFAVAAFIAINKIAIKNVPIVAVRDV